MPEVRVRSIRRRRLGAIGSAVLCAAVAASIAFPPSPWLVWNVSASAPTGLYLIHRGEAVERGDTVIAWPPISIRPFAARRRYLPLNVPLVKRVAAAHGDRVCARGNAVTTNGRLVARRRSRDGRGRPLPWWSGCTRLDEGETLLLTESPISFDGRYFGISSREEIVGRARLLWRR